MSKRQFALKYLEEKVTKENTRYLLKPIGSPLKSQTRLGSFDDVMISYSSLPSMSPANSKNLIDFYKSLILQCRA